MEVKLDHSQIDILTDLEKPEIQLLYIINLLMNSKEKINKEIIYTTGKKMYGENLLELSHAYNVLINNNLIKEVDDEYSLTEIGKHSLKKIRAHNFGEMLVITDKSKLYGKFCELVYGKNISQFNMMNMTQLNKLLNLMNFNERQKVLDIGCASGTITEYISDITQAQMTGIDFAGKAIEWAQERTKSKQNRLEFFTMDMDTIDFPERTFNSIISIDTLYFAENLENTFLQMMRILKKNGTIGIFYTQMIKQDESRNLLLPERTKLAQILNEQNLDYKTWDFTEEEKIHWRKSKEVAEMLKDEFDKEGSIRIYQSRIRESNRILEYVESDRLSRYLYFIEV
ncbi:MAG: class I SAM-dependent methyltransferase [Candidatus Celaenobacter polaris]|nr:class I SAM-dependent methyltransferase [Candidatus Celaenobacter polaris]